MKIMLAAAVIAGALLPAAPAHASAITRCDDGLRLSIGAVRGTMGHGQITVDAYDPGPACWLPAYPSVRLENASGRVLPVTVTKSRVSWFATSPRPTSPLAQFGLTDHFMLSFTSVGQPGEVPVSRVAVTENGRTLTVKLPGGLVWIDRSGVVASPWAPGR